MPKVDRSKIPFTNNASYPKEFAPVIEGREKQKLGDAVGLTQFGVNVSRIKAHSKSALRHWHESEDEFIYVLQGEVVLETNDGEQVLRPGMCAGFPAGTGDAHRFVNRTASDVTLLVIGDRTPDDEISYPDVDMHAVLAPDGVYRFSTKSGEPL